MLCGDASVVCQLAGLCPLAYVGPGAGLVISLSLLTLVVVVVGALFSILLSPLTVALAVVRRLRRRCPHGYRRVVVLGLDGLDPKMVRRLMDNDRLPHMKALADKGAFRDLRTTRPSISPSVWSSFAVGADASYHGIYGFVSRDPRTCEPVPSSTDLVTSRRIFRLGRWQWCLGSVRPRLLRRGTPFWEILGQRGLETTILRVPITYPPRRFRGRMLSGMCVPDIAGTQGTYSLYGIHDPRTSTEGGQFFSLKFIQDVARTYIVGPQRVSRGGNSTITIPIELRRLRDKGLLRVVLPNQTVDLAGGQCSSWITLQFRRGMTVVRGLVRFCAVSIGNDTLLYMTAVHVHPEFPATAISHPRVFSDYLAKQLGPFGTLGLMEDNSAVNDGALPEEAFLELAWDHFEDRKKVFFHTLRSRVDDVVVCVFDTPDRIQHMFWKGRGNARNAQCPDAVEGNDRAPSSDCVLDDVYVRMDQLIGETVEQLDDRTLLLVISDHGFTGFRREVDLNAWLKQQGYLRTRESSMDHTAGPQEIDWSRTKAYAMGLTGIYINLAGRERHGIVAKGEPCQLLLNDIKAGLQALRDSSDDASVPGDMQNRCTGTSDVGSRKAVRSVTIPALEYGGPYTDNGPDLLVGYEDGYRCAWHTARGHVGKTVFTDNQRPWCGDHTVDADLVPGVLLSNHTFDESLPSIVDIAPTVMDVFGIAAGPQMKGRSLLQSGRTQA